MSALGLNRLKSHFHLIAIVALCIPAPAFSQSLAEFSYWMWKGRCPKASPPAQATARSEIFECGFGGAKANLLEVIQTGQTVSKNTYLAALADTRADALTCTLKQIETLQSSRNDLDAFVKATTRNLIFLGQLRRKQSVLQQGLPSSAEVRSEIAKNNKAESATVAALRFTNIPGFSHMVNHIVSQEDYFLKDEVDPKYVDYIESSVRAALDKSKKDLRADIDVLKAGAITGGESLSKAARESLAQDSVLIDGFFGQNPSLNKPLESVRCTVDAKYGQGAVYSDRLLMGTFIGGSAAARGAFRFGSRVLSLAVTGAAAAGSITLRLAGVLRVVSTLADVGTTALTIQNACFSSPLQFRAKVDNGEGKCEADINEEIKKDDCALTAFLSSLGFVGTAVGTTKFLTRVAGAREKVEAGRRVKAVREETKGVTQTGRIAWTAEQDAKWLDDKRARVAETLAALDKSVRNPAAGAFGPGSMMWTVSRERLHRLAFPRMGILQLSHPTVARVLHERSRFGYDSVDRIAATSDFMNRMIFGDMSSVRKMSEAMTKIHARAFENLPLTGPEKDDLFLWVHATTWDSTIKLYQKVNGPLQPDKLDKFYEESKLFADLLGIPKAIVPKTYSEFQNYMNRMTGNLVVTPEAKEILKGLLDSPEVQKKLMPFPIPQATFDSMKKWVMTTTTSDLPDNIKQALPVPVPSGDSSNDLRIVGQAIKALPEKIRFSDHWRSAEARASGSNVRLPNDHPKTSTGTCPFAALFNRTKNSK